MLGCSPMADVVSICDVLYSGTEAIFVACALRLREALVAASVRTGFDWIR